MVAECEEVVHGGIIDVRFVAERQRSDLRCRKVIR